MQANAISHLLIWILCFTYVVSFHRFIHFVKIYFKWASKFEHTLSLLCICVVVVSVEMWTEVNWWNFLWFCTSMEYLRNVQQRRRFIICYKSNGKRRAHEVQLSNFSVWVQGDLYDITRTCWVEQNAGWRRKKVLSILAVSVSISSFNDVSMIEREIWSNELLKYYIYLIKMNCPRNDTIPYLRFWTR